MASWTRSTCCLSEIKGSLRMPVLDPFQLHYVLGLFREEGCEDGVYYEDEDYEDLFIASSQWDWQALDVVLPFNRL